MATFYVPKIAAADYGAFMRLLKDDIPATHDEWLTLMERELTYAKGQGHVAEAVEITPDEFSAYCNAAQSKYDIATLKRLAYQKGARPKP
jgi:hypothetical protein